MKPLGRGAPPPPQIISAEFQNHQDTFLKPSLRKNIDIG